MTFALTRATALQAWQTFLPRITRYGTERNHVVPGHVHVSRLSPAVRFGLLSTEELVRASLQATPLNHVEKWVQELCWRTYWKGWLEQRPQVWQAWRASLHAVRASLSQTQKQRLAAIEAGESGIAIMDAFTHELTTTGYMHNHARMWWAGWWIHGEKLPWQLGAEFFFRHLLDADPASNTLSWRWVAGLQTPGKTYLPRRSNLERYIHPSLLTDASGLHLLEDGCISPHPAPPEPRPVIHPLPEDDVLHAPSSVRCGIWLHADDTTLETSPLSGSRPAAVAAFTSMSAYASMRLSATRIASIETVLRDGLARAAQHWDCPAHFADASRLAQSLAAWAHAEALREVHAMRPAVGPVADALPAIRAALQKNGITLRLVRRPWDAALHPQARAGFFPFWEKTRRWLEQHHVPQNVR